MPTLNWIQETAIDRYYETGSDEKKATSSPVTYTCRQCSKKFETIELRNQHELEHPVKNPILFIEGKELIGDEYTITTKLSPQDIEFYYVDHIEVNGDKKSQVELSNILITEKDNYFNIVYSNIDTPKKKISLRVCIANQDELNIIDKYFLQFFSCDDFTGKEIDKFYGAIQDYNSTRNYASGLVDYFHGIMAKDQRTKRIGFEEFSIKFNQAIDSLQNYNTYLSIALKSIISFNRNSFEQSRTGILTLDQAISFFNNDKSRIKENHSLNKSLRLPVDSSTAFIVGDLIDHFPTLNLINIENKINSLNKKYISQQDRSKLMFIAYKKAKDEDNKSKVDFYSKNLKNDSIFSYYYEKK